MNQQDSNADVHLGKCAQTSASEDHGHPVSLVLFTLLHVYHSLIANHHSHCPYKSENHDQTLLSSMLLYACYSTFNVEFNLM